MSAEGDLELDSPKGDKIYWKSRKRERESGTTDGRFAREVIDDQTSFLKSMPAAFSDSHPTLNVILGRAKPVLHGPNSTHSKLFHHGETTFRAG